MGFSILVECPQEIWLLSPMVGLVSLMLIVLDTTWTYSFPCLIVSIYLHFHLHFVFIMASKVSSKAACSGLHGGLYMASIVCPIVTHLASSHLWPHEP